MIKIPPAALEAGARALIAQSPLLRWDDHPAFHSMWRDEARACFLAMIEAWPGVATYSAGMNGPYPYIILPLPQEITLNAQDISALDVKSTREEISDE